MVGSGPSGWALEAARQHSGWGTRGCQGERAWGWTPATPLEGWQATAAAPPPRAGRLKVVLYNPEAVFFTLPLALLAIGSELDPQLYEVIIVDGRLERDPEQAVLQHLDGALCVGVTVLTGAPISDALRISRAV